MVGMSHCAVHFGVPAYARGAMPLLNLITEQLPEPAEDTGLSSAILDQVAGGEVGATLRLFVPGRIVAFGSQDKINPGYANAVAAVRAVGFEAVERLAGGKAAVFHEETIAFAWAIPLADPKQGIEQRFESIAGIVVDALARLGVDAAVGEIPGEYCPGRFSVSAAGRKVMGVGQRLIKGAAHVGGVVVAGATELVNAPLEPAYAALGYEWSPAATGSIGASVTDTIAALLAAFEAAGHTLHPTVADSAALAAAERLAEQHRPPIA